jgi:hypothetical protein
MPTHRAIYHQGEGDLDDVIAKGHANAAFLLEKENARAEANDRKARKTGAGRMRTNLRQRPLYQYHFEVL